MTTDAACTELDFRSPALFRLSACFLIYLIACSRGEGGWRGWLKKLRVLRSRNGETNIYVGARNAIRSPTRGTARQSIGMTLLDDNWLHDNGATLHHRIPEQRVLGWCSASANPFLVCRALIRLRSTLGNDTSKPPNQPQDKRFRIRIPGAGSLCPPATLI
jgi:hypothetical protein